MKNWESQLKAISELTEFNDHTGAYELGAKILGFTALETRFRAIGTIRNTENGLDMETSEYQYKSYQKLMKLAEAKLTPNDYNQFYRCF